MEDGKDYPFLNNLLKFLPSALYMTFNQKTYHLSHGVGESFFMQVLMKMAFLEIKTAA